MDVLDLRFVYSPAYIRPIGQPGDYRSFSYNHVTSLSVVNTIVHMYMSLMKCLMFKW